MLDAVAGNVLLCDQNDEAALARLLEQHDGEIAAAIIEPTGANGGRLPIDPDFLHALRRLTAEHGVLLIFDEVVNGFRVVAGRRAGGLRHPPGPDDAGENPRRRAAGRRGRPGARTSSTCSDFQATKGAGKEKIAHPGTFNANPLSAAAGIACAEDRRARPMPAPAPTNSATICARRLNEVFEEERVPWAAYGTFSSLELFTNPERVAITPTEFDPLEQSFAALKGDRNAGIVHKIAARHDDHGVDLSSHPGGVISATHGEAELEDTVAAMRNTVRMLKAEGEL